MKMHNMANTTGYYLDPEGFVPAGKNESYFALGPGLNADGSNRFIDPKDPDKFDYGSGHKNNQTMTEYENCTGEGGRHPYVNIDDDL